MVLGLFKFSHGKLLSRSEILDLHYLVQSVPKKLKISIKFWTYNFVNFCSYPKLSKNLELEEDRWCLMSEDPSSEDKPESVPTLQRTTF